MLKRRKFKKLMKELEIITKKEQLKKEQERLRTMKKKIIYLDIDKTMVELLADKNELEKLRNQAKDIFKDAEVIITEQELLKLCPLEDYDIKVLTMLAPLLN